MVALWRRWWLLWWYRFSSYTGCSNITHITNMRVFEEREEYRYFQCHHQCSSKCSPYKRKPHSPFRQKLAGRPSTETCPQLFLPSSSSLPHLFHSPSTCLPCLFLVSSQLFNSPSTSLHPLLHISSAALLPLFHSSSTSLPQRGDLSSTPLPPLLHISSTALPPLFLVSSTSRSQLVHKSYSYPSATQPFHLSSTSPPHVFHISFTSLPPSSTYLPQPFHLSSTSLAGPPRSCFSIAKEKSARIQESRPLLWHKTLLSTQETYAQCTKSKRQLMPPILHLPTMISGPVSLSVSLL
jgi:hypothetical protein